MRILQSADNAYLQGAVFAGNVLLKDVRHTWRLSRCTSRWPIQSKWDLEKYKTSDTLFVLGSGKSIADYNEAQFKEIGKHDSIGFNFWLLHPFVPTFYTAECKPDSNRSDDLWKNLEVRSDDYREVPVIFKYSKAFVKQCIHLPEKLTSVYLASHFAIPGMSVAAFRKWLTLLDSIGCFSPQGANGIIMFRQASLSWLITFAMQLGYTKIIFCGVDLNTPKYFFDEDQKFIQERGLTIPDPEFEGAVHPTNDAAKCRAGTSITEILKITDDVLLKNKEITLYTGAASSALYPMFPLYPWESE
jgi:hypothetical protein